MLRSYNGSPLTAKRKADLCWADSLYKMEQLTSAAGSNASLPPRVSPTAPSGTIWLRSATAVAAGFAVNTLHPVSKIVQSVVIRLRAIMATTVGFFATPPLRVSPTVRSVAIHLWANMVEMGVEFFPPTTLRHISSTPFFGVMHQKKYVGIQPTSG